MMAISVGENILLFEIPSPHSFFNSNFFLVLSHPITVAIVGIFCALKLYQQWKYRAPKRTIAKTAKLARLPTNYKAPKRELELKDE